MIFGLPQILPDHILKWINVGISDLGETHAAGKQQYVNNRIMSEQRLWQANTQGNGGDGNNGGKGNGGGEIGHGQGAEKKDEALTASQPVNDKNEHF